MKTPPRCEENCEVPEGIELVEMPPSRHAWSDIIRCPNSCGRTYMIVDKRVARSDQTRQQR